MKVLDGVSVSEEEEYIYCMPAGYYVSDLCVNYYFLVLPPEHSTLHVNTSQYFFSVSAGATATSMSVFPTTALME